MRFAGGWVASGVVIAQLLAVPAANAESVTRDLPAGTKVFLALDEGVTSKRKDGEVGQVIPCHVWRDVDAGGMAFIKAGTPATCKVGMVKHRNIGGIEGKISIAGLETTAVNGAPIILSGGYNKEGYGRKAVAWTVGLLLLWPALFITGGSAELPPGTIFDTYTANVLTVTADVSTSNRAINLDGLMEDYSVEFMLDEFLGEEKPKYFRFKVSKVAAFPEEFRIDNVNDRAIEPIQLKMGAPEKKDDVTVSIGEVAIMTLAKHFQKGINRVQVAYMDGDTRVAREVLIEVQM